MTIKVNNDQQVIINQIAVDCDEVQRNGVVDATGAPYAPLAAPYPKYAPLVTPGSDLQATAIDGFKANAAAIVRYVGPVYWQKNIYPWTTTITSGALFVETLPFELDTPRVVQAHLSMDLASNIDTGQFINYYVQVNSQPYEIRSHKYPNQADFYSNISASWLLTIPSGPVTIAVYISCAISQGVYANPGSLAFTFMG